jgi:hypothetical protein
MPISVLGAVRILVYVGSDINSIMSDGFALLLSWPILAVVSTLSDPT